MSTTEGHGGFCPGAEIDGVEDPPTFPDAADPLFKYSGSDHPSGSRGLLLLADGTRFEGSLFGSEEIAEGELVFTTGMCGYQESLTDPSFAGQVLTFTYPLLGNYGIHPGVSESSTVHPRGVVCRQHIRGVCGDLRVGVPPRSFLGFSDFFLGGGYDWRLEIGSAQAK